ncbi:hypothetical protein STCU_11063 [Strigomonas culicis]|uniref:Uncharacterized protein n=1 Tax=Strigomonas culicis TaxID=28005 RepID=S9UPY3_9TRYP|nr:hypothetical protein STCU_11063 [Strigomonas culicis]|eukprot:EPY16681.1 hypothetical protein STCU_11063 [Strigomonas culicis]
MQREGSPQCTSVDNVPLLINVARMIRDARSRVAENIFGTGASHFQLGDLLLSDAGAFTEVERAWDGLVRSKGAEGAATVTLYLCVRVDGALREVWRLTSLATGGVSTAVGRGSERLHFSFASFMRFYTARFAGMWRIAITTGALQTTRGRRTARIT